MIHRTIAVSVGSLRMQFEPADITMLKLALQHDAKVSAIKYIRERSGLGLKEAKDLVDEVWAEREHFMHLTRF